MEQWKRLALRAFQDSDRELFQSWLRQDHVAKWYEHPQDWLDEIEKRDGEYSWIHHYIAEVGGMPVGFCQFYEYQKGGETWHGNTDLAGTYSIDYLTGSPNNIRKGFGKAMIRALVHLISLQKGARLIIVQPDPRNKASCAALLSAGFEYDTANKLYKYAIPHGGI